MASLKTIILIFLCIVSISLFAQTKENTNYDRVITLDLPNPTNRSLDLYINEKEKAIGLYDSNSDSLLILSFKNKAYEVSATMANRQLNQLGYQAINSLTNSCESQDIASKKVIALTARKKNNKVFCSSLKGYSQDYITISKKENTQNESYDLSIWLEDEKTYKKATKRTIKGTAQELYVSNFKFNELPMVIVKTKNARQKEKLVLLYN